MVRSCSSRLEAEVLVNDSFALLTDLDPLWIGTPQQSPFRSPQTARYSASYSSNMDKPTGEDGTLKSSSDEKPEDSS
jgi:hypothetical protein